MTVASIIGSCLLFCLVFGMSATVDNRRMKAQLRNRRAILIAISVQFIILPFLGFLSVRIFGLEYATGVTLLIITTSPGGSYSNLWCSLFNADLALSVSTTAVSTLTSIFMLPLNLFIYSKAAFDDNIVDDMQWGNLYCSLLIVVAAIALGIFVSDMENSHMFNMYANRVSDLH